MDQLPHKLHKADLAALHGQGNDALVFESFAEPLPASASADELRAARRDAVLVFATDASRAFLTHDDVLQENTPIARSAPILRQRLQQGLLNAASHPILYDNEIHGWCTRLHEAARLPRSQTERIEALVESENVPLICVEFHQPLPAQVTQQQLVDAYRGASIVYLSNAAARLLGSEPGEMVRKRVADLGMSTVEDMLRRSFPESSSDTLLNLLDTVELHVELEEPSHRIYRLKPTFITTPRTGAEQSVADAEIREAWLRINDVTESVKASRHQDSVDKSRMLAMESAELYPFEVDFNTGTVEVDAAGLAAIALPSQPKTVSQWYELLTFDNLNVSKEALEAFKDNPSGVFNFIARVKDVNGEERFLEVWGSATVDDHAQQGATGLFRDVTATQRLQDRLQDKKTLESLGVLAGGIAHDFNNLLMSVLGYAELLDADLSDLLQQSHSVRLRESQHNIDEIRSAALRASELCTSLLAYAGEHPVEMRELDLSTLVRSTAELMEVTTGKQVPIRLKTMDGVVIAADQGQLTQVIMNLVGNAADAMRGRAGAIELSVDTACLSADERQLLHRDLSPQQERYARLTVRDEGCGMSPETLQHMYEPFFTTKAEGRGLGMAAVHGIVRDHQGAILVDSTVGQGTEFRLLFPLLSTRTRNVAKPGNPASVALRQRVRVLLVDDEDNVRTIASEMLRHLGCDVTEAMRAERALELAETHEFDCALVDITMPGMSGTELAGLLLDRNPALRVVLSSGYTKNDLPQLLLEQCPFIHKPYTLAEIAAVLQLQYRAASVES